MQIENDNRVLSVSYIHLFGPNTVNEARFGYNSIRNSQLPQEPIRDSDLGIQRTNAAELPRAAIDSAGARGARRFYRLAVCVPSGQLVIPFLRRHIVLATWQAQPSVWWTSHFSPLGGHGKR